ncbi:acetyl-CoA carboxylase biotin carboxylase subunit [Thermoleophilum album]|uniref:acetyl-CoA carboxylase biotin carboxylase subunit n=1 Tax=Thermoleophilum album TaxID=29539 RepID=UPI00237D2C4B|nr:acetyl-CoA carboxylase biotin carboxylase subunit [Thermoleophilum album]WDT93537.1 acetyl-CoA carboxylase biotin carboxylase subunit [Thermoleophilum album]
MFDKVLVANRGEIAIRVMRTLEELGIASVAVYSEPDRDAPHVRRADEAYLLGPGPAPESYLNIPKIIEVAQKAGAQAIHPGYGFLAENATFARACADAGIVFIGPPPEAIEAMGSKTRARELMKAAGVPIVPGTTDPVESVEEAAKIAAEIGYPVAFKAAGGGGGKGFRVAESEDDLEKAFEGASREGEKFFADPTVYIERYIPDPRHVEVQILADDHGNIVYLFERDCSIQRRHQKLIEEAPGPLVTPELRERIGQIGVEAARAVGYRSAGTVEGLLSGDQYYFLEMNTRVQVEHCVTEMVTGVDIVREQIRIAAGEPISFKQEDLEIRGHAIECRINAESAAKNFAPAPGKITHYREPAGPGVRVDSGVEAGYEVLPLYDPMIAKLIVWDVDREAATRRMLRALHEYEIGGIRTLIPFHKKLLATEQWARGETCRDLLGDKEWLRSLEEPEREAAGEAQLDEAAEEEVKVERRYAVEVSGRRFDVRVIGPPPVGGASNGAVPTQAQGARKPPQRRKRGSSSSDGASGELVSPIQGTVLKVAVQEGAEVEQGALICVIEAMKMENEITAPVAGKVVKIGVNEGGAVAIGETIAVIQ